jgi:ribosomal protein L30E
MTFIFVQNGTKACVLGSANWPSNVHGGMTVSSTLSSINVQQFVVSNNGSDLYAVAQPSTGMTGGTP